MTRTNRTRGFILVSLLTMAVVLASSSIILSAIAQDQGTAPDPQLPPREPPWMSQLTDDQKAQIQQLIESLRASGATQQEIRDAVNAKLQEWGIQLPAPAQCSGQWLEAIAGNDGKHGSVFCQTTELRVTVKTNPSQLVHSKKSTFSFS